MNTPERLFVIFEKDLIVGTFRDHGSAVRLCNARREKFGSYMRMYALVHETDKPDEKTTS